MSGIERPQHEGLEARVADAIAPTIEHMGYELVRVQVSGKERPVVQIMADRADDAPFRVEDCEAISHAVGAVLDVEDPIRGEWTLEVSSAGIDRPLTRIKDWNRFAGHVAAVELVVPQEYLVGRDQKGKLNPDRGYASCFHDLASSDPYAQASEVARALARMCHPAELDASLLDVEADQIC